MEIFHAFGVDWRLLLIQAVNFGVLLLALWVFLYKPLLKLLDERRAKIEKGVHDANLAEMKLEGAEAEKKTILVAASKEADALAERSRKALAEKEKQATADVEQKIARMMQGAEKESVEMKAQALVGAKEELARLIVLGVEKTLRTK